MSGSGHCIYRSTETGGGPGKEEESFKAFLRKIQGLGSKFSSEVEGIKNSLGHSTVALYATKKWEKKVLDELSGSIRKIDDLIERYEYNTSQSDPKSLEREKESQLDEIITNCVQQIKEHMARFKEGAEIPKEKTNGINGTQDFIPPEAWLKTAEENVKGKLQVTQVTAPKIRYNDLEPPLKRVPKGLSSLSEPQVLKGFIISRGITSDSCRLKDLAGLKKLRKLSINIARGAKANDDLMELKTFDTLSSLTITWGQVTETPSLEISLPNLKKLDLQCLPQLENLKGLKSREFPELERLYIRGGKLKGLNPTMTETEPWHVDTLRLKFLSELELDEWSNLEGTFPSLAYVEIYKCPKVIAKPLWEGNILISEEAVWEKNNEKRWIQV
ncbi:hypothetical protein AAC387_Pa07g1509 [Persea americana]